MNNRQCEVIQKCSMKLTELINKYNLNVVSSSLPIRYSKNVNPSIILSRPFFFFLSTYYSYVITCILFLKSSYNLFYILFIIYNKIYENDDTIIR